MLRHLKLVAWAEGLSFLLLLFVAMPLKYALGRPEAVRIVGMIHGLLFLGYVGMLTSYAIERGWPRRTLLLGYLSSVLPFAPFWFERRYLAGTTAA